MHTVISFLRVIPFLFPAALYAVSEPLTNNGTLAKKFAEAPKTSKKKNTKKTIRFNYTDEDLIDIINYLAAEKGANILLPVGANAITTKVTLHIDGLLDLDEAWDILLSILDLADYSLFPDGLTYLIAKNSKNIGKEALPLYIGIPPSELPDNDGRIRYLYYLSNIKVSEEPKSMLMEVLKDMLPDTAIYKVDPKTNGLLISDKANNVRAVMSIITALDQITFRETMQMVKLRYTSADTIAKLFMDTILTPEKDKNRYRLESSKGSEATFFPKNVKVLPVKRTNSLILLGTEQAVQQINDFIFKYIDVALESGKSILHIYQLQYLDAATFEPVLKNIVKSTLIGGTGQSTGTASQAGPERSFQDVIIKADTGKEGSLSFGGNKLVIAATNEDWKVIKPLIEELDKPQRTVILEVLIADLSLEDERLLGSSIRNPNSLALPNFQTVQETPFFIPSNIVTPAAPNEAINNDLLGNVFGTAPGTSFINTTPPPVTPGSTLISITDDNGQTWGIGQIVNALTNSKILSHPHVISTNNKEALIQVGQRRLLQDEATAGTAATTIKFTPQDANLTVKITPRISAADTVSIKVTVDVTNFVPGSSNARNTRNIETNALVKSEDVLALGGLISTDTTQSVVETPLLGQIPIIGWFFKNRASNEVKTNLTVFISPTIIEPRLRSGVSDYSKDYIKVAKRYAYEGELFDNLRDPITRWFFKPTGEAGETIDDFLEKDELKQDMLNVYNDENTLVSMKTATQPVVVADYTKEAGEIKNLLKDEENPLLHI